MSDETTERSAASRCDGWYLAAVGALLVTMILALAVLWLRERGARMHAEQQLIEQRERTTQAMGQFLQGGGAVLPRVPGTAAEAAPAAVHREVLPSQKHFFLGGDRTVLFLGREAGERLGFREGDVILVGLPVPATASSPATLPSR